MEIGAVIAATPEKNVRREVPMPGDVVILLGGATGRDGCGGATGSSKSHTSQSLETCGAEVQKGNAPEERKLQRLFRNTDRGKVASNQKFTLRRRIYNGRSERIPRRSFGRWRC